MKMNGFMAAAMAGAMALTPLCMAETMIERGDLIIDRDGDGVEDIGYIAATNEDFLGNWQDEVSQRATMEVTQDGDTLHFVVNWADSADQTTQWIFDGKPADDGVVDYTNGEIRELNGSDENDYEIVGDFTEGCVAIDTDGTIYWTDTESDESSTLRFVKVPD